MGQPDIIKNNPELKKCYDNYNFLLNLLTHARARALSDKSNEFIKNYRIPVVLKKKAKREKNIEDYFAEIEQGIIDNTFINMVATFERIVFSKLPNAIGLVRNIVEDNYPQEGLFHLTIKSFIKDANEINNLATVQKMLSGKIPEELSEQLDEIISYRNRVSHGKRFGENTDLTLEDVLNILSEILQKIG